MANLFCPYSAGVFYPHQKMLFESQWLVYNRAKFSGKRCPVKKRMMIDPAILYGPSKQRE
jgi:hypothetical protein